MIIRHFNGLEESVSAEISKFLKNKGISESDPNLSINVDRNKGAINTITATLIYRESTILHD